MSKKLEIFVRNKEKKFQFAQKKFQHNKNVFHRKKNILS